MAKQDKERDPARAEEAVIVDQLIRQLRRTDPALAAVPAARSAAPRLNRLIDARPRSRPAPAPAGTRQVGIWARVGLGLLGIALAQWPARRLVSWLISEWRH